MTSAEHQMSQRRLLFVVNDARFFLSHRMPIAEAALATGYHVVVACPASSHVAELEQKGVTVRITADSRRSHSGLSTLRLALSLFRIFRQERPDLVHLVTSKPIILGGAIARWLGLPVVAAISGLGFIFTQRGLRMVIVRKLVMLGYRFALRRRDAIVIFQNVDDRNLFQSAGTLGPGEAVLIEGSGADLKQLVYKPEPAGRVRIILPARMLRDKGVIEFAAAAKILGARGVEADFDLLGDLDRDNPTALTADDLRNLERTSNVKWRPHTPDIAGALASAHIVAFPSYREGLPKSIVDAAACGRPVVTTNVTGCRDAIVEDVTGLLVQVGDSRDLADKLEVLVNDSELRRSMGAAARIFAEQRFDVRRISSTHLDLYERLLARSPSMISRRRRALLTLFVTGAVSLFSAAVERCLASPRATKPADLDTDPIDVTTLRGNDPDDTLSFQRAIAIGRPLYVPAGKGSGPDGVYRVNRLGIKSGTTIYGDGPQTVIQTAFRDTVNLFYCDSESTSRTVNDISLHDFTIESDVETLAFREHFNLLAFSGVSRLRIARLTLRGFRGDAIYIGAGGGEGKARSLRRNVDIRIEDCTIDGVNRDNRNGISITGGERILIRRCQFWRCSRGDMPGPIDFEPDAEPFYYLKDVEVSECTFIDCGGSVGQIAIEFPAQVLTSPTNIVIQNNIFKACRGSAADVSVKVARALPNRKRDMSIRITGNRGEHGFAPFRIWSADNVAFSDNQWRDYPDCARIGGDATSPPCQGIRFSSTLVRCGTNKSGGLEVYAASDLEITRARFEDCGNGSADASGIQFLSGRLLKAVVADSVFTSTDGVMKRGWHITGTSDAATAVVRASQNHLSNVAP